MAGGVLYRSGHVPLGALQDRDDSCFHIRFHFHGFSPLSGFNCPQLNGRKTWAQSITSGEHFLAFV